jgi:hypothetical protein
MTISTNHMQARVRRELAMPSRLGHTALLTASAIVATGVTSLLLTEPELPARTRWAFLAIILIAVAWMAYAGWVLMRRRVLFGKQRVAAARLACLFTIAGFAGSVAIRDRVGPGAVVMMAVMTLVAGVVMVRARQHVRTLEALARELAGEASR